MTDLDGAAGRHGPGCACDPGPRVTAQGGGCVTDAAAAVAGRLVGLAASVLEHLVDVSVVQVPDGRWGALRCAGPAARTVEEVQERDGCGPLLDALAGGGLVHVADTAREPRYPAYAEQARRVGITASVSACLLERGRPVGALSLYARSGRPFDDASLAVARALADLAATTLTQAAGLARRTEEVEQMHEAMASRSTIEQAKGMLVATSGCSPEEAFRLLREMSRRSNRKVRHLAEDMVHRRGRPT